MTSTSTVVPIRRVAATMAFCAAVLLSLATPGPADSREFELVTPFTNKHVTGVDPVPVGLPALNGDSFAYQVRGNVNVGPSGDWPLTHLAVRSGDQWRTTVISPPAPNSTCSFLCSNRDNPFVLFDDNLTKSVLSNDGPPDTALVPGEPLNRTNAYLRDNATHEYTLLTNNTSAGEDRNDIEIGGASDDLSKIVFKGVVDATDPNDTVGGLYFWSAETGTILLAEDQRPGSGASGLVRNDDNKYDIDMAFGGGYHSVSSDGSRVFATEGFHDAAGQPGGVIHVHKDPGTTGHVDQTIGQGVFRDATPDGRRALLTSCHQLTPDSTAQLNGAHPTLCTAAGYNTEPVGPGNAANFPFNDLYIWDEEANGGAGGLTDITTQDPTGAKVLGVLGAATNLNRVYFAAAGDLDGGGPAIQGEPNIYFWQKGSGITFIATGYRDPFGDTDTAIHGTSLEPMVDDFSLWQLPLGDIDKGARVTPDGRTLAFTTKAPIDKSFDNRPPSGEPFKQVYLWKVGWGEPRCVTCIGDGPAAGDSALERLGGTLSGPPEGATDLPTYSDWQPQNLTADGTKIFINSGAKLTPDSGGPGIKVYEYDIRYDRLEIISHSQAVFLGATPNGSDVFIRTHSPLVSWDEDDNDDIYNARIGGGQPDPTAIDDPTDPPCQGSTCPQPPTSGNPGLGVHEQQPGTNRGARKPAGKKCPKKPKAKARTCKKRRAGK